MAIRFAKMKRKKPEVTNGKFLLGRRERGA
jgi:hypothetical protein